MKSKAAVPFILFAITCAFGCHRSNTIPQPSGKPLSEQASRDVSSISESGELSKVSTRMGELAIVRDPEDTDALDERYFLVLNGKKIDTEEGAGLEIAFRNTELHPTVILLKSLTGGNGCAADYKILDLTGSKFVLSPIPRGCYTDIPKAASDSKGVFIKLYSEERPHVQYWRYIPAFPGPKSLVRVMRPEGLALPR